MTRISPRLLGALMGAMIAAACSSYDSTIPDIINGVSAEDRALESTGGISTVREGNRQIVRVTGKVTTGVDQFRTLLDALNPNTAGQKSGGCREINWDGVPPRSPTSTTSPAISSMRPLLAERSIPRPAPASA